MRATRPDDASAASSFDDAVLGWRRSFRLLNEATTLIRPAPRLALDGLIATAPPADGHTVLVLPAALRDDGHTNQMRDFLAAVGYRPYGWDLGINLGPTASLLAGATRRLETLSDRYGPVSLVGFSMGGLFARWLGLSAPERVRQVVTVCSPFRDPASSIGLPLDPFLHLWPGVDLRALAQSIGEPLRVPGTFIYTRSDGIVKWRNCRDDAAAAEDNIEVEGPHVMMAKNPVVMRILAQRLARDFSAKAHPR